MADGLAATGGGIGAELVAKEARREERSHPQSESLAAPNVYTETTPSGLVIEYEPSPRRLYRVNGQEVPSVTTVLGVLDKPALSWWGMKVGVQGVLELLWREVIRASSMKNGWKMFDASWGEVNTDDIVRFLTQEKLTVNHVVKEASDRGLSVHDAFETWARTGLKPFVLEYPEEERGYIDGLNAFLADLVIEPEQVEVMVGSAEHGFAGRFDARLAVKDGHKVVVKSYPKRAPKTEVPLAGSYLCDLKTSKSVYTSHHLQLAAYELAAQESGYEPTDFQAVIHVTSDGQYEFVVSKALPEHFLAVKEVYDVLKELS